MNIFKKIWFMKWCDIVYKWNNWFQVKCPQGTIGRGIVWVILVVALVAVILFIFWGIFLWAGIE